MAEALKCRNCGVAIPVTAPFGHCPKCLLTLGFVSSESELGGLAGSPAGPERSFGDCELLEQIGRGGMGVVYRARQKSLNRTVALKMIRAEEFASPEVIRRFYIEAEAAANLQHPNIVPIYEIGEHGGLHFYIMELIEGESLDKQITKAGFQMPGRDRTADKAAVRATQMAIARIIATVARAMHYAHQRGVLHRDLKPSNIVMDEKGQPHLTDFGIAKLAGLDASGVTATGSILGTPSYMAPEQAAGQARHVTTAADIYSLGAILYEMLTGRPPFRADTPLETIRQVIEQPPKHPTTFKGLVDRDLATICLKCLEKDPHQRYSSAEALAEDLEHWQRREPIVARPVGTAGKVWRWAQRNPRLALMGATTCLLLLATITLASVMVAILSDKAREREEQVRKLAQEERKKAEEARDRIQQQLKAKLEELWSTPGTVFRRITSEERAILEGRQPMRYEKGVMPTKLTFGMTPHTRPLRIFERFSSLLTYLETNITEPALSIDLVVYSSYSSAIDALVRGEVQFMRPGPASYVLARQRNPNLRVLVNALHGGKPIIHGVFFTRPDTGILQLGDVKYKSLALGDPDSTFGNYVSKSELVRAGIYRKDLAKCEHHRSHDEAVKQVIDKAFQAGAANSNEVWLAKGADLKMIHFMHSVSFPWVASATMPPDMAAAITKSLLSLRSPNILTNIDPDLTGFKIATPDEYDEFEKDMKDAVPFD